MSHSNNTQDEPTLVTNRTLDIVVAVLFLVVAELVIFDCVRLGFGWNPDGPAPGYFPFYVAVAMALASLVNLYRAFTTEEEDADGSFVTKPAFKRVLQVLIPTIVYVLAIEYLGIYVASAIFIMGFMFAFGRDQGIVKTVGVGIGVPLALFMMFEKWFLVPLPKGPLEAMLGLG
jgi:putative tricarboxylic transport membrane protein